MDALNQAPVAIEGIEDADQIRVLLWQSGRFVHVPRSAILTGVVIRPEGLNWTAGSGSPEGVVTAPPGSLYSDTDGGAGATFWVKESGTGSTGWTPK